MVLFRALFLVVLSISISNGELEDCSQGVNCHLPDCFCPSFSHPLGAKKIPQIVYFGFDDAVTPQVGQYYDHLFTEDRVNPNGCPITMSLYVCHRYTIYSLVSDYYRMSDEVAVHSVTHTYIRTAEKLRREAIQQRQNIQYEANIPNTEIIGWRSPNLITAGDDQPRVLKELNYTYDISLPYESDERVAFPYTLDYGYPYTCSVRPCPSKDVSHKGFWEVPINTLFDPVAKTPCTYVDSCRPDGEEAAYKFLMHNFLRSYNTERAPFGLNMHAAWFYWPEYLKAMDRFIQTVLTDYPDTYIVSVSQMMAWMMKPQTIEQAKSFAPWSCDPWKAKKAAKVAQSPTKVLRFESEKKEKKTHYPDLSRWVKSKLSLNIRQNWFLRHRATKSKIEKKTTPLSDFVNKRLSLNYRQNVHINHKLTPYDKKRSNQKKLADFVNPRLSLNYYQNVFINHKLTPFNYPRRSEDTKTTYNSNLFKGY